MDTNAKTDQVEDSRDADQVRMDDAAKAILNHPDVYAQLHEYDDACQENRKCV